MKQRIRRIYKLLVAWMHVQWLHAGYSEDVYICPWHAKGLNSEMSEPSLDQFCQTYNLESK